MIRGRRDYVNIVTVPEGGSMQVVEGVVAESDGNTTTTGTFANFAGYADPGEAFGHAVGRIQAL